MGFFDKIKDKAKNGWDKGVRSNEIQIKIKNGEEISEDDAAFFESYTKKSIETFKAELENKQQLKEEKIKMQEQAVQKLQDEKQAKKEKINNFSMTNSAGLVQIDSNNHLWRLSNNKNDVHDFRDLAGYELLEDGTSITKGGIGIKRAIVGGVLFGPAGAILGGLTKKKETESFTSSMEIRLSISGSSKPTIYIPIISKKTSHTSSEYKRSVKEAQNTLSLFDIISNTIESEPNEASNTPAIHAQSEADELRKYKNLLDDGILTQDEFDAKKKQLLGL